MARARKRKVSQHTIDGQTWERVFDAEEVLERAIEAQALPRYIMNCGRRHSEAVMVDRCHVQRKARDLLGREHIFGDIEVVMQEAKMSSSVKFMVFRPVDLAACGTVAP